MNIKEMYKRVNDYQDSELHLSFRLLLGAVIVGLREKNDIATTEDVLKNQGAIKNLKKLLKNLEPQDEANKTRHYDGAYI